jgi:hypothetical protein
MSVFYNSVLTTSSVLTPGVTTVVSPLSPIVTTNPYLSIYPSVAINPYHTGSYYYDSGIGDNPHAQHLINKELRYKFLDKYLHEDYPDILRMLKSTNGVVKVLSSSETEKNDISNDTDSILEDKIDFIGNTILTYSKNKKILHSITNKNAGIKYYDLPHNTYYVKKEQAKYVKRKLKEMRP